MYQKVIVLLNETAGTALTLDNNGLSDGIKAQVLATGHAAEAEVWIFPSDQLMDRIEAAAASDADVVLVGGGDGSAAAAATKLRDTKKLLGVIPLGTMNLFAKDLGISLDWREAIDGLLAGEPVAVDVGEVNDRLFLNRCSIGFYPRVIDRWQHTRGSSRVVRYLHFLQLSLSWWLTARRSHLHCEIDGAGVLHPPTRSIFVVNNPYNAVTMGPVPSRPNLDTGKLGVYIAYHQRLWELLRLYTSVLAGVWQQDAKMIVMQGSEMVIRAPKKHQQKLVVDGELLICDVPLHFRSCPGALRVLRPIAPVTFTPAPIEEVPALASSAPALVA